MKSFSPNASHKENSKLSRQGKRPGPPTWKARRWPVRLEQDENEQWIVFINDGPNGLPASDVEVSLWLENQELKEKLEELLENINPAV